jgi:hemolysin D
MQRDNAAHLAPDAGEPANDARDTPLNRLLRRANAVPEAPDGDPLSVEVPAPETLLGAPPGTPVPRPETTVAGASAGQVSPAEMLVKKLLGKQNAARNAPRPHRPQAPASKMLDGDPIDVDYVPLEPPAGRSSGGDDRAAKAAAGGSLAAHDAAPAAPVAKPPVTRELAPEPPADRSVETRAPAPAASIGDAAPDRASAPAMPVASALGTRGPMPANSVGRMPAAQEAAPAAPAFRPPATPGTPLEPPVDGSLCAPEPVAESPIRRQLRALAAEPPAPENQGTALGISPGTRPRTQERALGKSAGRLLRLPRRTRDEREFLPAALEIVDTPPSPVGRAIGFTIILLAIIAIGWSVFGKVDIVATASGRIVPAGKTKIVQPADTGIVTAIHVSDGDHVKAGDVLIELNSNQVSADRDRFVRDLLQANLNLARLRGLAATLPGTPGEGREPDLVDPPKDAKPEDLALTLAAMRAQAANENARLADLDQQIEAKRAEAAEAAAAAQKLQASLPMLADQEQLLRTMRDQKIGSKLDWYQVNQQLIEQKHEIGVLAHRREAAEAARRALREQRAAEATQYQMAVLSELDKVRAQASELNAELAKSQQRVSQNVLLAPIDGTVQQLSIHTIGGVVTPAESLLAIVPADDSLVVEAAVQNRDVGFIRAGQTVRVKVEAFNFTLYGLIEGKVLDVTRDAVSRPASDKGRAGDRNGGDAVAADGESGPVYLARVALARDWMMTENGRVDLTPGMAVTAEIQTGERRLISYLLSPLVRHVSESMRER